MNREFDADPERPGRPHVPEPNVLPITFAGRDYDAEVVKIGPTIELRLPDGASQHHELSTDTILVEIPVDARNAEVIAGSSAVRKRIEVGRGRLVAVLELQLTNEGVLESVRAGKYAGPRLGFDGDGRMDRSVE